MTYAARVHQVLDRPSGRRALGTMHSLRHFLAHRRWVPIRWVDEGYWEVRLPDRVISQPHPDPDEYIEKEQIARDAYFHRYVPQQGDVMMHVGAGAGWEAHLMSSHVGASGHVYLVEAQPRTYEWLERRVRVGGLENCTPVAVAVTDHQGRVTISDTDRHQLNRIVDGDGLEVPCDTIGGIMSSFGVEHIDLLTMNIEGAEREAIKGLADAATSVRRMAISCHDFLADRGGDDSLRTREEVVEMLVGYGFDVEPREQDDPRDWIRGYVYAERDLASLRPLGQA